MNTLSRRWRWNPMRETETRYGPPTRMAEIVYRPSSRVTAAYREPDSTCSAMTLTPGAGAPFEVMTPVIEPVVTPWACTVAVANANIGATFRRKRASRLIKKSSMTVGTSLIRMGEDRGGWVAVSTPAEKRASSERRGATLPKKVGLAL